MILPCTKSQFKALNNLFNKLLYPAPTDIRNSLAHDLFRPIQRKLNNKVRLNPDGKKSWNLSLTDIQAKSYYSFFEGRILGHGWEYEQLIIDGHLELIRTAYEQLKNRTG